MVTFYFMLPRPITSSFFRVVPRLSRCLSTIAFFAKLERKISKGRVIGVTKAEADQVQNCGPIITQKFRNFNRLQVVVVYEPNKLTIILNRMGAGLIAR